MRRTLVTLLGLLATVAYLVAAARGAVTLQGHQGQVRALAFSRDGQLLVSGGADGAVLTWDANTGRRLRTMEGHRAAITCLVVSPNSRGIASGDASGTVRVWSTRSGARLWSFKARCIRGHSRMARREVRVTRVPVPTESRIFFSRGISLSAALGGRFCPVPPGNPTPEISRRVP